MAGTSSRAIDERTIKEVVNSYSKLIQLDPKNPDNWYNRAIAYVTGSDYKHAITENGSA